MEGDKPFAAWLALFCVSLLATMAAAVLVVKTVLFWLD